MESKLGISMKRYEQDRYLVRGVPVIGRLDGKAFHTLTKGMDKPYDTKLQRCMWETAKYLCANVQGCRIEYCQSDEITLLVTDFNNRNTDAWFDYRAGKMFSIGASLATGAFIHMFAQLFPERFERMSKAGAGFPAFDARFDNFPKEKVLSNFIWRQRDCEKNSLTMLAQQHFSHKQLHGKNGPAKQDMLHEIGINWNDQPTSFKRGVCVVKQKYEGPNDSIRTRWIVDEDIPIFTQEPDYIMRHLDGPLPV